MKLIVSLLFLFFTFQNIFSQKQAYKIYTLAFYNLENLFDTIDHQTSWTKRVPYLKFNTTARKSMLKN